MTTDELADEIFGRCHERIERGETVDEDDIVRAHPDLADALRERFAAARLLAEARAMRLRFVEDHATRVGASLGPYRLESVLGAGGMGTVYLARAEETTGAAARDSRVAVKVFHPHLAARERFTARFLREAELGRRVRHENVVATLDACETTEAGRPVRFLVMEHVEGRTLREFLAELGRLPEELVRHVGREVAAGLAAIHAAGAIHRDLKPENVIVTKDHAVKVMDLGVARVEDAATLSETGAFVGSVRYGAPEQFGKSGEVDARADLHALGLLLFELAAGVSPFAGDELGEVVRQVLDVRPRPLGELAPQVSPFLEELVGALLEKDREKRPASAALVASILGGGESSAWWKARAAALRRETRRPLRRIRIPRETALYGREDELGTLRALFDAAKAGDGRVVLVEGEAGIGKSRLVDEFVGRLAQSGEDVNFLYGSYPPGGAATASGAFTSAYREHLGDDDSAIRAALPQTPLLAPAFTALLRGDVAPAGTEPLTKDSMQTVFVHATRSFAAQRTTVVLIDDLHFAPQEGCALFASLALAVPGHRILLVGTARPEIDAGWIAQIDRIEQVTRVRLPRLGAKDLVLLLRDSLGSEHLAEELAAKIAVKSDGNPFFVFEILRGLREGQFLTRKPDGTWATTKLIAEIEVPETVKDLIFARVGSLSTVERNLLDVAACAGFEFDPVLVGEVLRVGRIPVLQRLAAVEKSHRLVRSVGRRFAFDHHQIEEVLYAALPEMLREEYHGSIADAIERSHGAEAKEPKSLDGALCVDLAEHYLAGAQGQRALRYLDAALDHLQKGYRNDAAVRLADRALAVPGLVAGRVRCDLLLRNAGRLCNLGRRDAELAALEEASAVAIAGGEVALHAWAKNGLGWLFGRLSRHDEAQAALREARALACSAGDRRVEAAATGNLGMVQFSLGRLEAARTHQERHLALSRETGNREDEVRATMHLGLVIWKLGHPSEALAHLERCVALAIEIGDRRGEASGRGNLGSLLRSLGRVEEARAQNERALTLSRELGSRPDEAAAMGNLGNVSLSLGRLGEARERFERCLALSCELGSRAKEVRATGWLGYVLLSLGRLGEARKHDERFLALSREIGARRDEGYALQALADLAAEEGDAAAAERRYEEALTLRREMGHRDCEAETLVVRGVYLAKQGREAEARADLDAALAIARELSRHGVEVLATAALATLPGGAPQDHPQDGLVSPGAMVAAAVEALAAHEALSGTPEVTQARFLLWQATRDPAHLAEAKRLLDFMVEHAPADCRESMLANVRLHREIAAAAREEGLPLAADSSRRADERPAGSPGA